MHLSRFSSFPPDVVWQHVLRHGFGEPLRPRDPLLPGNFPDEGSPYACSAVVNSELQPTPGFPWLLCDEEHDEDVVHLQKAAPCHWFSPGERIRVEMCPTRFGPLSLVTESLTPVAVPPRCLVKIQLAEFKNATLLVHLHPPDRQPVKAASLGELHPDRVTLPAAILAGQREVILEIS